MFLPSTGTPKTLDRPTSLPGITEVDVIPATAGRAVTSFLNDSYPVKSASREFTFNILGPSRTSKPSFVNPASWFLMKLTCLKIMIVLMIRTTEIAN